MYKISEFPKILKFSQHIQNLWKYWNFPKIFKIYEHLQNFDFFFKIFKISNFLKSSTIYENVGVSQNLQRFPKFTKSYKISNFLEIYKSFNSSKIFKISPLKRFCNTIFTTLPLKIADLVDFPVRPGYQYLLVNPPIFSAATVHNIRD